MSVEKRGYSLSESQSPINHKDIADVVNTKGAAIGEAADIYGNVQEAEEMGYVHRGLKSRHIQFIALGMLLWLKRCAISHV
jgi:yeast amino acid transporter